jgi:hypothetical protein
MGASCPSTFPVGKFICKTTLLRSGSKRTCGSGDTCIAGFLSALLRDLSPEETLKSQQVQVHAVVNNRCLQWPFIGDKLCDRINSNWKIKTEF